MELMKPYQVLHKHTYDAGLAADDEKEAAYIRSIQKTRMNIDAHNGRGKIPALRPQSSLFDAVSTARQILEEVRMQPSDDPILDDLDSLSFPPNVTAADLRAAGIQLSDPETTRFPSVREMLDRDAPPPPPGHAPLRPEIPQRPRMRDSMVPDGWERLNNGMIVPERPKPLEPRILHEGFSPEEWKIIRGALWRTGKAALWLVGGLAAGHILFHLFS